MPLKKWFTTNFEVLRYTKTTVDYEVVETWTNVGSYKGRLDHESTNKTYDSGQQQFIGTRRLYCPADTDVLEADRILVDGKQYRVLEVIDPFSLGHHKEVVVTGNQL